MVVLVALVALVAGPALAQDSAPRTAWGEPDLQGVWDFRTITPMQRPERYGDKQFLTAEEAAALDQAAVDRELRLWNQAPERTEAGGNVDRRGAGQAPGSYNQFWIDSGTRSVDTRQTSLITYPPNGRYPSLTAEGQRRSDERRTYAREHPADTWEDFSSGVRCILGFNAGPPFTPSAYNNNMQLFQTPDHVVVMTEMVNTSRVIPLDGTPHLDPEVLQWSGDSRGYWEGETLVVETRNFDAKRKWRGTTSSARLVERFTRVDADTLEYQFTVTDPETWTSPWTASVPLRLNPEPMFEYACHEGNYSVPVMLGGARVEEAAGQ
ncbi:uncharacterized protein METZ01_LOCUS72043 [marine metagenome]|uniref:Uncharacterized protein n=1 Tax=marine metagenome TaxID=408172 RepID=A0A381TTL8_9ZZZZ